MFGLPLESLLLYLAGALGFSKSIRNTIVEKLIESVKLLGSAGDLLKGNFLDVVFPKASAPLISPNVLQGSFLSAFNGVDGFFVGVTNTLTTHASDILNRLEPDEKLRSWRVFGYLFQLSFLIMFAYADLIQLVNNLAPYLPQDVTNNPWFQNLSVSLLITSVGTAIAAGFIFADFAEITNFGRWNDIKKTSMKFVVQTLVWLSFVMTLVIDVALALGRIPTFPDLASMLSPELSSQLVAASLISQSFVIVPLLIVTFLLLGGLVGIAVLYVIVIWLISFVFQIFRLIITGVLWLLIFGISYLVHLLIRAILWIVTVCLFVFGWIFAGTGETLVKLLEVGQKLLDIIYLPMDALIDAVISYFKKRQQPQVKLTPK